VSLAVGCAPPLLNEISNRARVLQAVLAEIRCWWREDGRECSMVRMDINRREIEKLNIRVTASASHASEPFMSSPFIVSDQTTQIPPL
jgi:hypothetical protein